MSWWKKLAQYAAPVAGAALGSIGGGALGFSPAIGGALGGALGGFAGGEFGGAGTKGSLLEAGLGGAGGYFAGPSLAELTGVMPEPGAVAGSGLSGSSSIDDLLKNMGTGSAAEASIPSIGAAAAPGVTTGAGAAAGAGAGAAGGFGGIADFFKNNPALVAGGVGLGAQMLGTGNADPAAEKALNAQAKQLGGLGSAGLSGNLSPSAQVAYNDAVTTIKAQYANMGLGGSTMEAQDIAAAKERAVSASAQEGLQELGMSNSLYGAILGYQQQQDSQLSDAISNLMQSIGYGLGAQGQGAH